MTEPTEFQKMQAHIAELERRIVEEREEFQWDLKTRCESYELNIRRLEDDNAQLKQVTSQRPTETAELHRLRNEIEQYTQRALKAERRVAELQEEIKRAAAPVAPPLPRKDPILLKRVEEAERERDQLRQNLTVYESELLKARENLAHQTQRLGEESALQEQLKQKEVIISQLQLQGKERDQKLQELSDQLQLSTTLEAEYNSMRRQVEQAQARNLQLEQILAERGVPEQPTSYSEYQNVSEVVQTTAVSELGAGRPPEYIQAGVVAISAEPGGADELLPVIAPDELYPEEAAPSPASSADQALVEPITPVIPPTAETVSVIQSESTAITADSVPTNEPSSELNGMAEAWVVTDEPRQNIKPSYHPQSDADASVDQPPLRPTPPHKPLVLQENNLPEPIESSQHRSVLKIILIIIAVLIVMTGVGIAVLTYYFPDWLNIDDCIATVNSWISELELFISK